MSLIDFGSGDWVDERGNPVNPCAPSYTNHEIKESDLRQLGFRPTGSGHWQCDFDQERYRGARDHISIFVSNRRLVGNDFRTSEYHFQFESFHVTFVFALGNVQFHFQCWGGNRHSRWRQGGHTQGRLIREWGGDVDALKGRAVRIGRDFIRDLDGYYHPEITGS